MITNPAETMQVERFSFFASVSNSKEAIGEGTIEQFHRKIVSDSAWEQKIKTLRSIGDKIKQNDFKKNSLPAISASVWIKNGVRKDLKAENFTHTNLIQVDLDDCPNPDAVLEKLKNDPHARLIFHSPRGRVKALMKVKPVETIHDHRSAWEAVNAYCKAQGYGKMDQVPKGINHLCIISHDPEAILKEAIPLPWEPLPKVPRIPSTTPRFTNNNNLQSALDDIPSDDYDVWIGVGMALYHDGGSFDMWDVWSQKSEKYPQSLAEMQYKWQSFATDRENKLGFDYIYNLAEQYGGQPPTLSLLDPNAEREAADKKIQQRGSTPQQMPQAKHPDKDENDARSYYNRGEAYYKNGDYDNAIAGYTQAIELSLDSAYYAYLGRADTYHDKGSYDNAIADCTKAIKLKPDYAPAYFGRGYSYYAKGYYDKAILDLTKAIKLNSDYADAYYKRGEAYYDIEDYDNAIADYTKAIELNPDFAEAHFWLADAYFRRGVEACYDEDNYDSAIADYTKAIELNPNLVDAYYNRGEVYYDIEDYDNAIADYTKAIGLNPNLVDAYYNRGEVYYDIEDYDKAIADYTEAIRLNPDYAGTNSRLVDAYCRRGEVCYDLGGDDNAIADYTEAIKLNPDYAAAYFGRGLAYRGGEDYDRAIADYTKAIKLNPDYADAYSSLVDAYSGRGEAYYDKGDYDRAIADYTKAICLNPDVDIDKFAGAYCADAYCQRGLSYYTKGDFDRAIADYTKAIKLNPDDASVYRKRKLAYQAQDNRNRANTVKPPDDAVAYYNRGEAYLREFDYDNAIKNLTQAIDLKPDFADAYSSRGVIYFAKGDYDCAISDLTQVIQLEPDNAKVQALLKQVYQRKDNYKRAIVDGDKATVR